MVVVGVGETLHTHLIITMYVTSALLVVVLAPSQCENIALLGYSAASRKFNACEWSAVNVMLSNCIIYSLVFSTKYSISQLEECILSYKKLQHTPAVRSNILSKPIFASCVWYSDRAHYDIYSSDFTGHDIIKIKKNTPAASCEIEYFVGRNSSLQAGVWYSDRAYYGFCVLINQGYRSILSR